MLPALYMFLLTKLMEYKMESDNVLEEALEVMEDKKKDKEKTNKVKIKTFEKRTRISIEAMFIVKSLVGNGWGYDRIAAATNVMEITVRKWATGERVPHMNNFLALRKLRETK